MKNSKMIRLMRLILTSVVIVVAVYTGIWLEFWSQLQAFDNIIGVVPLILLIGISVFLLIVIWRRCRDAMTIALIILTVTWTGLFIPAVTGSWYPFAGTAYSANAAPDLSVYAPFREGSQVAVLPEESSIILVEDLPKIDGATALYPLYSAFARAVYDPAAYSEGDVVCTNTPNAYQAMIAGDIDIIFVAGPSQKQREAAENAGVELVYTPLAWEAFVFLTGSTNPVEGLTIQQIRNIYSGKTAKWKTLGWEAGGDIIKFQRPEGSGSQTGLQGIMGKLPVQSPQPLPDNSLFGTGSMMQQVSVRWQGIQPGLGYSYRYYATVMYPNPETKLMKIEGVYPSNEAVADGSYPFTANFYAVTNGEPEGNVKQLIDWILSEEGQYLVEQTGYVPIR